MKDKKIPTTLPAFLWFFIKKYKISFILYALFMVLLLDLPMLFIQPYLLKVFIDKIVNNNITTTGGLWLIVAIVCSDVFFLIHTITNILSFNSITRSIEDIRSKIFRHLITQSADFFNTNYSGELVSKLGNITNSLNDVVATVLKIIKNLFLLSAMVLVLSHFNVFLGILTLVWVLTYSYIGYHYMLGKVATQSALIQDQQNKIVAFTTDDFVNAQNIKVFSGFNKESYTLSALLVKQFESIALETKYKQISSVLYLIINCSFSCFIVIFAIFRLKSGAITLGDFAFLTDIVRRFIVLAREVIFLLDSIRDAIVMKDSLGLITNDTEIRDKPNADKLELNGGKIVFRNVNFLYNKHL